MAVYACRSSVGAAGWTAAASGLSEVFLQTRSRLMTAIIGAAHHAAMTSGIVLLTGESGTGKRTLARQIHQWSSARGGRFTAVDCGAMSPSIRDEPFSRIICAGSNPLDRGTIFFAHIEDLSLKDQGLLLRFIETMSPACPADDPETPLRLIMAASRRLDKQVDERRFRGDLLLLISAIHLQMPPLRERREDILPLADHMLAHAARRRQHLLSGFSPEAAEALPLYDWPGNLRELRGVVHAAALAAGGSSEISLYHLPPRITALANQGRIDSGPLTSLEEMEREHIARVLSETGSLRKAASILGIHLSTLWRKRRRYNLHLPGHSKAANAGERAAGAGKHSAPPLRCHCGTD